VYALPSAVQGVIGRLRRCPWLMELIEEIVSVTA
jgi:hypothetical protein